MPRLPIRFPSYQLPPVSLSTSSSNLQGWDNLNAAYAQNLFELEQANPYVRMLTVDQSITTAGFQTLTWNAESTRFQRQGMLALTTGTSFIEIPFDGLWIVDANVVWDASSVGSRLAWITQISGPGSTGVFSRSELSAPAGAGADNYVSATVPLFKGTQIALQVRQLSGAPLNIFGGEAASYFSIAGVGVKA